METEEFDDLAADDDVADHRARAADMLDQIARQTKQALSDAGIDLSIFLLVPSSGQSIVTFGCPGDPSDAEWARVGEIISGIVQQSLGLRGTRCREVQCATTHDQALQDAAT